MESLLHDLRYTLRMLVKWPLFSALSISTLALAISANTAMFSIVNAWLLRPLPLKDPQRLVAVWKTRQQNPTQPAYFDYYHDYLIWAGQSRVFESLAGSFEQNYSITGSGEAEQLHGAVATWNIFQTLGASPALGRLFSADDARGEAACVISYSLWKERFHSSRAVLGSSVTLNEKLYRVLGVLPADFSFRLLDRPFETAVWTVITNDDKNYNAASPAPVSVLGRLQPGITVEQAQEQLSSLQQELNRRFRDEPENSGVLVVSLQEDNTRTIRSSLLLLFGAVVVLLVIACVNTGSLILGRNAQRAKEFAVRVALGSGIGRLLQQLTVEILVLFLLGGLAGLALAFALVRVFVAWNPFGVLPPGGVHLDATVLAVTAAGVCLTALLFGSLPAFRAVRVRESDALRAASLSTTSAKSQLRSRFTFVAAQISLSLMLLVAAGLLISTLLRIDSEPLGFSTHDVFATDVALPYLRYASVDQQGIFARRLLLNLRGLPALRFAGASLAWPFNVNGLGPIEIEGEPAARVSELPQAASFVVSDGYFDALGIPLLRGREFTESDGPRSPPIAVINEEMARQFFPDTDPLGKRIRLRHIDETRGPLDPWLTVVGVVGDTRSLRYNQIQWDRYPAAYTSLFQREEESGVRRSSALTLYLYMQTAHPLAPAAIASAVHSIDPDVPLGSLRSAGEIVQSLRSQPHVRADMLTTFALLTLVFAAIGIGGAMAQMVEHRRREMGIRIALGAETARIRNLVLSRALTLAGVGIILGIAGAIIVARLLSSYLYGVSSLDPWTFTLVIAILCAVSLLAAYIPARRATKCDPMLTLKCE
ncbi:MAG: ABC transporter permease [Acidobacteria bacterium]|nr:ABC transporter permease [Acidobacteriota bacterium]